MESSVVRHLRPEFAPVAVVWSDTLPDGTVQYKKGRFGCVLHLFAQASRQGKITGGNRETITCGGGRVALGLAPDFATSREDLHNYSAVFSKGLKSARNIDAYEKRMQAVPVSWRHLYEYGERRHCSFELAESWLLNSLPRYDVPHEYVLFKPLHLISLEDNMRAVIFPVNPVELAGLVILAGSVMEGTDPVQVPQGPECTSITAFAYAQAEQEAPRAVLGLLGIDGRKVMRKRFRDDILTLTLPTPLFHLLEQEADDCVFQIPSWKKLMGVQM